ncbi:MAG: hypothetical protein MUF20_14030, partial [Methylotetracoccus sp.]|nr:hypothetical protein [Methylotetracoccus sp.]
VAIIPAATRSWLGLAGISLDMLLRSPARGYRGRRGWQTLAAMLRASCRNLSPLLPDVSGLLAEAAKRCGASQHPAGPAEDAPAPERRLSLETITLKQFRDTQSPDQACYQAIISSPMGIDRVNRFGLLGDYTLLRGDVSGGYTLRIHRYPAQPIIEALGLEVAEVEEGGDGPVAILKPVLPFWTDVDLYYGRGRVLCSRAQCFHPDRSCTAWTQGPEEPAAAGRPESAPAAHSPHGEPENAEPPRHIPYITTQGAAAQPIAGPFHFPDVTLQVYPLLADRSRLQGLLDEYLNQPLCPDGETPVGLKFEAFGSYVYLMVSVQGGQIGVMWSEANNIGWWADKEVSCGVPVKCYRRSVEADGSGASGSEWQLISLGMVSPFIFGNTDRAVITDREVNGRPTVQAIIDSPTDAWLTPAGPIAARRLLKLETEVFPALHLGQQAERRTLLEIDGHDVMPSPYRTDDAQWREMLDHWGEKVVQELQRKTLMHRELAGEIGDACSLAAELLCLDAPCNSFHLKQYRDAAEPDHACYQALVKTSRRITRLYDLHEIDQRIHIRLHKYPGFPIAETLGIKVKHVDSNNGTVVQILEPVRPFWMRLGVREELGEVLCWRTQQRDWTPAHPWSHGSPEEAGRGAPPFFAASGHTGVIPGAALEQVNTLCTSSIDHLRCALEKELAAMQQTIAANPMLRDALAAAADDLAQLPRGIGDVLRLMIEPRDAERAEPPETETPHPWFAAIPARELYTLVERLSALLRRHGPFVQSDRLSRAAARQAVERLAEVQLVIEAVLARSAAREPPSPIPPPDFIPGHSLPEDWVNGRLCGEPQKLWTMR